MACGGMVVASPQGMAESHAPACGPAWERSSARELGGREGRQTCGQSRHVSLSIDGNGVVGGGWKLPRGGLETAEKNYPTPPSRSSAKTPKTVTNHNSRNLANEKGHLPIFSALLAECDAASTTWHRHCGGRTPQTRARGRHVFAYIRSVSTGPLFPRKNNCPTATTTESKPHHRRAHPWAVETRGRVAGVRWTRRRSS